MPKTSTQAPKLTDKQKRFAEEYIASLNATKAAILAGYAESGARAAGSRMLSNVVVQEYIQQRKIELDTRIENKYLITRERVLNEYAKLAFSDLRSYYNEDGTLKNIYDLTDDEAAALSASEADEIRVNNEVLGYTRKIKVYDKNRALDSIAKVMGYNAPEKRELTGPDGKPIDLKVAATVDYSKLPDDVLLQIINARTSA